ncbi:hypothetical protein [Candidatus Nitrospira salsa]
MLKAAEVFCERHHLVISMNHQRIKKVLAIILGCCFLTVSTSYAASMANHATAHHSPDSHTQSWCDWLCKAAQAIQTPAIQLDQSGRCITPLLLNNGHPNVLCLNFSPGSRGPPVTLFS